MTKLSNLTVSHIETLMESFPDLQHGTHTLRVYPATTISSRELQLFWKYHGNFPQEFTQAIINLLPANCEFISYDHLLNNVTVIQK